MTGMRENLCQLNHALWDLEHIFYPETLINHNVSSGNSHHHALICGSGRLRTHQVGIGNSTGKSWTEEWLKIGVVVSVV